MAVLRDRYRLDELLRSGSAISTYRAIDESDGSAVVVKELALDRADDARILELFEREASVLQGLSHPRIPDFIDSFEEDVDGRPRFYLVQRYVDGMSLDHAVSAAGQRFDEAGALRIAAEICDVLIYLHERSPKVLHRDIKPGNIVLDSSGAAHLIDFGAVRDRLARDVLEGAGTIVGTFGYMPMEQFEGKASIRSDLYALGMTLVHVLTRHEPWTLERGPHRGLMLEEIADVSPGTLWMLRRLTAVDLLWERRRSAY